MAARNFLSKFISLVMASLIIVSVGIFAVLKHFPNLVWQLIKIIPVTIKALLHLMIIIAWALLNIFFIIIKTLLVVSFGLIFSPIWYPIYLIIRKQKHLLYLELLSLIISRDVDVFGVTQHDVQMKKIKSASTDAFTFDYDMLLMDQLNELIEEKESWLVARIDWKATDEVEPQLNALLTTHNIKGHFRATTLSESVDSIPFALCEFDYWLVNKQYRFILWDQGSDEYTGFICETSSCERLLELAKKLTLTFKVDMANEFNICVDKATVIEHLTFLIASSKARNIKQGIDTFSFFVDGLNDPECSDINALYESLYSQTCGMMRYADYTDEEYEKVMSLIHILQLYEVKMKAGLSDF